MRNQPQTGLCAANCKAAEPIWPRLSELVTRLDEELDQLHNSLPRPPWLARLSPALLYPGEGSRAGGVTFLEPRGEGSSTSPPRACSSPVGPEGGASSSPPAGGLPPRLQSHPTLVLQPTALGLSPEDAPDKKLNVS